MAGKTLTVFSPCRIGGKLKPVGSMIQASEKDLTGDLKPLVDAGCFTDPAPKVEDPEAEEPTKDEE